MGKELNLETIKQGLKNYKKSSGEGTEFEDVCIIALNLVNELEKVKKLTLGGVSKCGCCGKNQAKVCNTCLSEIAQDTASQAMGSR